MFGRKHGVRAGSAALVAAVAVLGGLGASPSAAAAEPSPAEAREVATEQHPAVFERPGYRPLRLRSGERVDEYVSDSAAVVERAGSESFVESTVPLRARDRDGRVKAVDFTLEDQGGWYSPRTAPLSVMIGKRSGEPTLLANVNVAFEPVIDRDVAGVVVGPAVHYADVIAGDAVDWAVEPLPDGAESYFVVRGAPGPRVLTVRFTLPDGALLRATSDGGAVIEAAAGDVLANVLAPVAWDDADRPVAIRTEVAGDELRLTVDTTGATGSVVVDPVVAQGLQDNQVGPYQQANDSSFVDFVGWQFVQTDSRITVDQGTACTGSTRSQCVGAVQTAPVGATGQFFFPAWGTSFINRFDMAFLNHVSAQGRTRVFGGIFDPAIGTWQQGAVYSKAGSGVWTPDPVQTDATFQNNDFSTHCGNSACTITVGAAGNQARWGIVVEDAPIATPSLAYLRGAAMWQNDRDLPHLTSVNWQQGGFTTSWSRGFGAVVRADGVDTGLGVKYSNLYFKDTGGADRAFTLAGGCTGERSSRCPHSAFVEVGYDTENMPGSGLKVREGVSQLGIQAFDLLGKGSPEATQTTIKLDRTKPTATLSGSLTQQSPTTPLTQSSYQVVIDALDGDASIQRSGVQTIHFDVLGPAGELQHRQTFNPTCTGDDCQRDPVPQPFNFDPNSVPGGQHYVSTTVVDRVGNSYTTAAGDRPSFVTLTALPVTMESSGLESRWQYDELPTGPGSTAYVNVGTGNLVWQHELFTNVGRGLNTVATLTHNSMQPLLGPGLGLLSPYNEVGNGFSLALSTLGRVNEALDLSQALNPAGPQIALVDGDGTRHVFTARRDGSGAVIAGVFNSPPGVNLQLRQYTTGEFAWAFTRPDGVTFFFDALGYQRWVQDRNGNRMFFDYRWALPPIPGGLGDVLQPGCGAAGELINLLNLPLPSQVLGLVCKRQLVYVKDAAGIDGGAPNRSVFVRYTSNDSSGRIAELEDHGGRKTRFAYNGVGELLSVTQAAGEGADERTHRFQYVRVQEHSDLVAVCDPLSPPEQACSSATSHSTAFAYSPVRHLLTRGGPLLRWTNRRNSGTRFGYDGARTTGATPGYGVATVTDAREHATRFDLDAALRPTKITDARGTVTELRWDADHNLDRVREGLANGGADMSQLRETFYEYNANGLLTKRTEPPAEDGVARITRLTYRDSAGTLPGGRRSR